MNSKSLSHESVLRDEVLEYLVDGDTATFFDGTLGLGGHAEYILENTPTLDRYIACDLDSQHLAFATERLSAWSEKVKLNHGSFSRLAEWIDGAPRPLSILLDLGLCSNQLDDASKGFAFAVDGPLTMAFDDSRKGAAADLLNNSSERELMVIFREYGEEPAAMKIARAIVRDRAEKPFETTSQLTATIESAVHPSVRKKSFVRVFQAVRIAVNEELDILKDTLDSAGAILQAGDRLGVISYHSLEDRIVKKFFATASQPLTEATSFSLHTEVEPASFRIVTKKPVVPSPDEVARNPRSRSAKFRVIEKI